MTVEILSSALGGGNNLLNTIVGGFGSTKNNSSTNATATGTTTATGTKTSQKVLTQEAINKLIYDALSADAGIASLATGENLSGGYGNTTKALLAQDFMVKLIGELANVTAPTVTTEAANKTEDVTKTESTQSSSKKRPTVICTELHEQGKLSGDLYGHTKAFAHFDALSEDTIRGYHAWAIPVVGWMKKSPMLCSILTPIVQARYRMITTGEFNLIGAATIYIGQPICTLIGKLTAGDNCGNLVR